MKKRLFDPTISIGNIISLVMMVGSIGVGYANITNDLAVLKYKVSDTQLRLSSIENRLYSKNTADSTTYQKVNYEEKNSLLFQGP